MNGPLLAIRADASRESGTGHVMRSLAVAQEWRQRGGRCVFLCSSLPGKMRQRLESEGCEVFSLNHSMAHPEEADETSALIQRLNPRWLLLDGYGFDQVYQRRLQPPRQCRIACISDFGSDEFHTPDLIIHPNIAIIGDYDLTKNEPRILAGPQYVLLRKELRCSQAKPPTDRAANVLISIGGSDPGEAAVTITTSLIAREFTRTAKIRVILGPAYPDDGAMHDVEHPAIEIVRDPESMGEHYAWADTAICSPSTTSLELAHHGIPTGLILTAANQLRVLEAMLNLKTACYLGDAGESGHPLNLEELFHGETRVSNAQQASRLIDGKGVERVCDVMDLPSLSLRPACQEDARDLWHWANDTRTRSASFNPMEIPWEDHLTWLNKQLNSSSVLFLVAESSLGKIGTTRFEVGAQQPGETVISITLAPASRGLGLAPLLLQKSADVFFAQYPEQTIVAWIKGDNAASERSFISAGYEKDTSCMLPDRLKMKLSPYLA